MVSSCDLAMPTEDGNQGTTNEDIANYSFMCTTVIFKVWKLVRLLELLVVTKL